MVNIALGNADMSACQPGDANGDGQITVDEISALARERGGGQGPARAWPRRVR